MRPSAPTLSQARAAVLTQLRGGGVVVLAGEDDDEIEVELAATEEALDALQVGYAVHGLTGEDLTTGPNAWHSAWLVIGTDDLTGDPYFVDLARPSFPVFTAMHGAGRWDAQRVSRSLKGFLSRRE